MANRTAKVSRKTNETDISVSINLDGSGVCDILTPVPFLDHMLSQLAKHGGFDINLQAKGDTEIDFHHTVEDVGISLGESFRMALGDKAGIRRFGFASAPLNEALASVAVDISGRPFLVFNAPLKKGKVGEFDAELVEEFFHAFSTNAGLTLHVNVQYGSNMHHIIESVFKSLARALGEAVSLDPRRSRDSVPSTKGVL